MGKRIVTTGNLEEDIKIENHLRPQLLKDYIENDIPRKPFCDGLVYEVIGIVEDILREKEVLPMIQ